MKIVHFEGREVRGYMNFDISFNPTLSFLIGINGTGKTTVLKLISALLTPSYLELAQIEYSYVSLTCEVSSNSKERLVKINCAKENNKIKMSFSDDELLLTEEFFISDLSFFTDDVDLFEDGVTKTEISKFESSLLYKEIKELPTSIVLGLNRKVDPLTTLYSSDYRERFFVRSSRKSYNISTDSLNDALGDIVTLIHTRVRESANGQYKLSELFRQKVFAESFTVEEHFNYSLEEYKVGIKNIEERRVKLNDAIEKLGVKDLSEKFALYFDSINDTLKILSQEKELINTNPQKYYNALLKWMVKSVQLEKVDHIINYANDYTDSIQRIKEPIRRFVESVNLFFKESGKEIEVDNKGELVVKVLNKNKKNTIYDLSSGEKQLVVMLARIALHTKNRYPSIFIIDEPELSLHISWQEIFVDALLKASPNTQYILATHAPAIISDISRRRNCIDLTRGGL